MYIPGLLEFRIRNLNESREQVLDRVLSVDSVEDRLKAVEEAASTAVRVGRGCEVESMVVATLETLTQYSELHVKIARMLVNVAGIDATASNLSHDDLKWRVSLYDRVLASFRKERKVSRSQYPVGIEGCHLIDKQESTSRPMFWVNEEGDSANLSSNTWSLLQVLTLLTGLDLPEWTRHVSGAVKRGEWKGDCSQQDEDHLMKLFSLLGTLDGELTFKVVEKIDNCWLRSKVLANVTVAMVSVGQIEEARHWVVAAEQSAVRVQELFRKTEALASVAAALMSVGQFRKSEEVAGWAHKTALQIPTLWRRLEVLTKLLDVLADSCLVAQTQSIVESALRVVDEIEFPQEYANLLSDLVSVLARTGDCDGVRRVAENTLIAVERSELISESIEPLVRVVGALSVIGDGEKARGVAKFALSVWKQSEGWLKIDEFGVQLAVALVQVNQVDEALGVAGDISDPAGRARVLVALAEVLAEVGDVGKAKLVSERAVNSVVKRVEDPIDYAKELVGVVNALVAAGDVDRALRVAKLAVSSAAEADFDWQFLDVVRGATAALAREVRSDVVLEIVDLIEGPMGSLVRSWALVDMAGALARAGNTDAAFELEAQIEVNSLRPMVLMSIAEALAEVGQIDVALNFVSQIERCVERVEALTSVANALALTGHLDKARQVFESAVSLVEKIECSDSGVGLWLLVVNVLVWDELNDMVPGVVKRIEELGLGGELGDVSMAVLLTRANRLDEALDVVERIEEPRCYMEGLIKVACAMVRMNRVEGALRLIDKIEVSDVAAEDLAEFVGVLARAGAVVESLSVVEMSDVSDFRSRARSAVIKQFVREGLHHKALNVLEVALAEVEGFVCRQDAADYCSIIAAACIEVADFIEENHVGCERWLGLTRSVLARSWFYGASVWDRFDILMRVAPELAVRLVDERILADPEQGTAPESDPDLGPEGPGGDAGSYR